MNNNDRIKTIVIMNPSDKFIKFFRKMQAEKAKRREELLKKEQHTFTVQM